MAFNDFGGSEREGPLGRILPMPKRELIGPEGGNQWIPPAEHVTWIS